MDIRKIKRKFDQEGFIYLPGFLDYEEVKTIRNKLEGLIQNSLQEMPSQQVKFEDKNDPSSLKMMQDLNLYDPYFSRMLFESKFRELAETLLEEPVIGKTIEYFNKPAIKGKATPPHQDGYYFMLHPVKAVTMWMALEEVGEENGWVSYIKGSQLRGMRPHSRTNTVGFSQGITDFGNTEDLENEVFLPAKPGDLLIHHALTIHRAGPNTSKTRSREALGLIYFGTSAKEDLTAKEAYLNELNKSKDQ